MRAAAATHTDVVCVCASRWRWWRQNDDGASDFPFDDHSSDDASRRFVDGVFYFECASAVALCVYDVYACLHVLDLGLFLGEANTISKAGESGTTNVLLFSQQQCVSVFSLMCIVSRDL